MTRTNEQIAQDVDRISKELSSIATELAQTAPPPTEILVNSNEDLQVALDQAPSGATVRIADGTSFNGPFVLKKPVHLTGKGSIVAHTTPGLTITGDDVGVSQIQVIEYPASNVNDLVVIRGARTTLFDGMAIQGTGTAKRGIAANGSNMLFSDIKVLGIGRVGQESQAVAIWDGTDLTIRRSTLQAASTPFLSGGASPAVPNHVPQNILLENCVLTHDLALRGQGYVCKTGFELKSGRGVIVRACIIENVWVDAQTGYAITLTPSQYGNSPETTVEDVLFENNTIRNVGGGLNAVGFSQHQTDHPTQRGHNWRFFDNTFQISRAVNGGHGSLMQLGIEPADIVWERNIVTQDGDAFLRTTDKKTITGFSFTSNEVNVAGTYGVFTPTGSRGVGFPAAFPGGVIEQNAFTAAHAIFKVNFPNNTWR